MGLLHRNVTISRPRPRYLEKQTPCMLCIAEKSSRDGLDDRKLICGMMYADDEEGGGGGGGVGGRGGEEEGGLGDRF